MIITSCKCYQKRYEKICKRKILVSAYGIDYSIFDDTYLVLIIDEKRGVIEKYSDVRCCQFCGKKIKVKGERK